MPGIIRNISPALSLEMTAANLLSSARVVSEVLMKGLLRAIQDGLRMGMEQSEESTRVKPATIVQEIKEVRMRIFSTLLLITIACTWSEPRVLAEGTQSQPSKRLYLRGKVISTKVVEDSPRSRYSSKFLEIKLILELVNSSPTPIIFLNREPLFVGAALAKHPDDFATGNYLVRTHAGPAVSLDPEWSALRLSLDKPTPPPDQTRILMPNESWSLEAIVGVSLPDHPEMFAPAKSASLKDIKELSTVWLRVVCEVWPWNLEPNPDRSKLNYGRKLQRRWRNIGVLWLDEIYSEPLTLNLNEINP